MKVNFTLAVTFDLRVVTHRCCGRCWGSRWRRSSCRALWSEPSRRPTWTETTPSPSRSSGRSTRPTARSRSFLLLFTQSQTGRLVSCCACSLWLKSTSTTRWAPASWDEDGAMRTFTVCSSEKHQQLTVASFCVSFVCLFVYRRRSKVQRWLFKLQTRCSSTFSCLTFKHENKVKLLLNKIPPPKNQFKFEVK